MSHQEGEGGAELLAAVIGDVIKSRLLDDRKELQDWLLEGFDEINQVFDSVHGFLPTIGDEFQGLYYSIGSALFASLQLQLVLARNGVNVRIGIGWGEVPILDETKVPFAQDGPAWWCARDAITRVTKNERRRGWPKHWRTAFSSTDATTDSLMNAFLMCRDKLLADFDRIDSTLALHLLRGSTLKSAADCVGISPSAASQRQRRRGIYSLLRAHQELGEFVG